jgi:DNA-binding response OmpR family regulator
MEINKPAKILVVDDNDELRGIISNGLSAAGYQVDQARDGEEAIAKLKEGSIELMTLEIRMPKEDGWGVLEFVTEQHLTIKVVVLTTCGGIESAIRAKTMGADVFLEKPGDINEVLSTIDRLLKNTEAMDPM